MEDFTINVIDSIDKLTDTQIENINTFLADNQQRVFSKSYVDLLRMQIFAEEVKSNDEFIYRGRFLAPPSNSLCLKDIAPKYAVSLCSCTSDFTRVVALLLSDDFKPLKICLSFVNCGDSNLTNAV